MLKINPTTMKCIVLLIFLVIAQCAASPRGSLSDSFQCPTPRLKNGRIRARGRGRIIRYSCSTEYVLVGNRYSTCIRGSWDTPTPICVSTRCSSLPVPKHAVVGQKYQGAILMYFCEPGYLLVGNAEIYCDGRHWNGTTPYCRDANALAPTSCDFEKDDLCWWEQDPKHDFDWIKHSFGTPSSHIGTGPTHDHTLGSGYDGHYLYIEASGRLVNDTARILSPFYNASLTESGCFSFWYHMYGATIGSLNVYFKSETDLNARLMWSKHGNQGNQWLRGLFNLPNSNSSFQIIVEGIRGSSYVSDIAIDDIAILQGDECIVKNVTLLNTTPANDNDEAEVFNAMQTCRDRCVNTLVETTPSSEIYSNPDVCQCTIDCAETSTCCPDYAEFCVYEVTDMETLIPAWKETVAPTGPQTSTVYYTPQIENKTPKIIITEETSHPHQVTTTTTPTTTTTNAAATANTKHSSLAPSTTRQTIPPVVQTIPTKIETTAETRATKKITRTTTKTPKKTFIGLTTTAFNVETPFFARISLNKTETTVRPSDKIQLQTEPHVLIQDSRQLEQPVTLKPPGIIGIVIGIVSGITITSLMALIILRRRKTYKRGSNGSAFSEDSDVRFLTSDEVLDFSLARPAGEDEET